MTKNHLAPNVNSGSDKKLLSREIYYNSQFINISKHFTRISLSYRITVDFDNYSLNLN